MADASRDTVTFQYLKQKATIRKSNRPGQFNYLIGFIAGKEYKFDEPSENVIVFQTQEAYNRVIQEASNLGFDFH